VKEITPPMRAKKGQPERIHYESERNGVGTLFMMCAPLEGWRAVDVRERKPTRDYAECLKALSDAHFAGAEKIVLVQDNLNTHRAAALYEAFGPEEAKRLKGAFRIPLHSQTCQLAQHRRMRTECAEPTAPGSQDRGHVRTANRSSDMDRRAQRESSKNPMVIHHG